MRAASLLIAALVIAGCGSGSDEPRFSSASFIEEANRHDAGLELGEPLPYPPGPNASEARTVRFEGTGTAPGADSNDQPTHVHGSGTLTVFGDDEGAVAEYQRCQAASLVCYRAANVELTFTGTVAQPDLDRLGNALEAMAAAG